MNHRKQLISFVIPCFNEEGNVDETFRQIKQIIHPLTKYNYEFIFIDNGSTDLTRKHITKVVEKDSRVTGIFLSRNFGPEASGLAGLQQAKGDVILACVCDLQDPLELIPEYIKRWERGADMVVGIYTKTADKFPVALIRALYYKFFKAISNINIPVNSSGITLFSRTALNGFLQLKEHSRSNVGLRSWIGFKTDSITYERRERMHGKSSYNLIAYLQTAERGFFGFSYVPLDLIIYIGFTFLACTFLFLIGYFIAILFHMAKWDQFTVIISVIILFGSIQLLAISTIGKYIQVIVEETKQRPHYIIEKILTKSRE